LLDTDRGNYFALWRAQLQRKFSKSAVDRYENTAQGDKSSAFKTRRQRRYEKGTWHKALGNLKIVTD